MKKYAKTFVEIIGLMMVFYAFDPNHALVGCFGVSVLFIANLFKET